MKNAPNPELSLLARQWGATAVPVGELSAEAWLETPVGQRAWALLQQTATLRSVILLSGPNGVGKSVLVNRWLATLDRRLFAPVLLTQATLSGSGVLSALTAKLGKEARGQRALNLRLIETALMELGKTVPLIVLDDAQNLAYGSLEEVRLRLGLNLAEPPAFGLVLIGDEYLLGALRLRQHRSLYSRIACHFSLSPWTPAQVGQYLQHSLAAVGISRPAIDPAALNLLTSASGGLARSLCLLARAAWIEAATAGFTLEDLFQVVRYLQKEIRHIRRNVGALKLSNLLQLDHFEEDLHISRVRLAPAPPPPSTGQLPPTASPAEQERGRQRALDQLRDLKDQLRRGQL